VETTKLYASKGYFERDSVKAKGVTYAEVNSHGNSGYFAVSLALSLGYSDIHVLGMDMELVDGRMHYYDEELPTYPLHNIKHIQSNNRFVDLDIKSRLCKAKVYDYSPARGMVMFPKRHLKDIL